MVKTYRQYQHEYAIAKQKAKGDENFPSEQQWIAHRFIRDAGVDNDTSLAQNIDNLRSAYQEIPDAEFGLFEAAFESMQTPREKEFGEQSRIRREAHGTHDVDIIGTMQQYFDEVKEWGGALDEEKVKALVAEKAFHRILMDDVLMDLIEAGVSETDRLEFVCMMRHKEIDYKQKIGLELDADDREFLGED